MKKIVRASLLVLALSCFTHAGHIPNGTPAPPTEPITSVTQGTADSDTPETADGHIPNGRPTESTVTEVVLNLLQGALSLF